MSKCGSELGEIKAQFVKGSFVLGEEGGKARYVPVGERKCKRKLEVSLQGLVIVESRQWRSAVKSEVEGFGRGTLVDAFEQSGKHKVC